MKPIAHFEAVWVRCDQLSAIQAFLASNVTAALNPDELLRSEWVTRLSALDLYIHELIAQSMVEIFQGIRVATPAFSKFRISTDTLSRIRAASTPADANSAFDLEVRNQLRIVSYQDPEKIADGVRLVSTIELWNEIALSLGSTQSTKNEDAKRIKTQLSVLVRRRNQMAHEGDLQPTPLRPPWPITQQDLIVVRDTIEKIVRAIDSLI